MAKLVLGKSVCSDWFFRGQDRTVFMKAVYFCFGKKAGKLKICNQRKTSEKQTKKTAKNKQKKTAKLSFFTAKLPEKAKKIEILPKFRTNILQASFIRLKIWKLLMQKLKQALPKARRP